MSNFKRKYAPKTFTKTCAVEANSGSSCFYKELTATSEIKYKISIK